MNRYFSRLAQRSGVNANTPATRFGNSSLHAESSWGEQTVETTATADTTTSTPRSEKSEVSGKTSDMPVTIDSAQERSIASTPLIARSLESNTSGIIQAGNHNGLLTETTAVSNPLDTPDTPSHFVQSRQASAVDAAETKGSKNKDVAHSESVITKTVPETAERDLIYSKETGSRNNEKIGTANKTSQAVTAYSDTSFDAVLPSASSKTQASKTDGSKSHRDNGTVAQSPAYSEKMLSRQSPVPNGKFEAIKSVPVQTGMPDIQPVRTSSSSSIEVNIGKIELEIVAPARKVLSAPAAAPAKGSRSKPAAVFNPHRHYLRGR